MLLLCGSHRPRVYSHLFIDSIWGWPTRGLCCPAGVHLVWKLSTVVCECQGFWKGVFPSLVMVANPAAQYVIFECVPLLCNTGHTPPCSSHAPCNLHEQMMRNVPGFAIEQDSASHHASQYAVSLRAQGTVLRVQGTGFMPNSTVSVRLLPMIVISRFN